MAKERQVRASPPLSSLPVSAEAMRTPYIADEVAFLEAEEERQQDRRQKRGIEAIEEKEARGKTMEEAVTQLLDDAERAAAEFHAAQGREASEDCPPLPEVSRWNSRASSTSSGAS